jgi:uncharacterized membrane protein
MWACGNMSEVVLAILHMLAGFWKVIVDNQVEFA